MCIRDRETELELVGATAIEDKLQDNVGQTISILKQAKIKVWVLTGDKIETAINIGYSCQLLTEDLVKIVIDGKTEEEIQDSIDTAKEQLKDIEIQEQLLNSRLNQSKFTFNSKESNLKLSKQFALIITGDALIQAMKPKFSSEIMQIADQCQVVIACRVSPKQKQEIVTLVRTNKPEVTTLAIGDGANDVNMICAAHVGIGIKGVEGQQASRASDYAIGEFQCLLRLVLNFGRESYRRNTHLICYCFFKNILIVLPQF
eukprot:TRINITY_DN13977_c0_g1_i1.p1 TRINITY_DN13977_c0_g1~~TRINITY_DN13977_c0_g1_i1.p1  ORF type:complete len:259 (+),score=36.82 TRINITY_DN13977_c0_g1_i1:65-841(+)